MSVSGSPVRKRGRPSTAAKSHDEALRAEALRLWFERACADGGARLVSVEGSARLIAAGFAGMSLAQIRKKLNKRPRNEWERIAHGDGQGNKPQPGPTQIGVGVFVRSHTTPDDRTSPLLPAETRPFALRFPRDGSVTRLTAQLAFQLEQAGHPHPIAEAMRTMLMQGSAHDGSPADIRSVRRVLKKLRKVHADALKNIKPVEGDALGPTEPAPWLGD